MRPVLSVAEARALDAAAAVAPEVLVQRAGAAVARTALAMTGGAYGRRVVVVAGKGSNGADGRVAAARLRRRGARVTVLDAGVATVPRCDLVVDAAYGTGLRGPYDAPDPGGAPVLAVDVPSGVDGDTGEARGDAVRADRTVTFAALKPGLVLGDGAACAGAVEVAGIGLDPGEPDAWLVEDADARSAMPARARSDHKWTSAVMVVGGSPGLVGAPWLAGRAALRAGAGNVRLAVPGADGWATPPSELYSVLMPARDWAAAALEAGARARAVVVGPGLGLGDDTAGQVLELLARSDKPVVLDADGLTAVAARPEVLRDRPAPTVLTPHDGEFERLAGRAPGPDRVGAARSLADRTGAVVLLKGPTTVVAAPGGEVHLAAAGSPALATAGTGDVLAGVLAAFLARGAPPLAAASAAAHAHGAAARTGGPGLVAGDLVELVPRWLAS